MTNVMMIKLDRECERERETEREDERIREKRETYRHYYFLLGTVFENSILG